MTEKLGGQVFTAIVMVLFGAVLFVIQDSGIKWLTADLGVAVLQVIFIRSLFGMVFLYGGTKLFKARLDLKVHRPKLLFFRTAVNVLSWCFFFTGLKYLELATATALFFSFPLFLTALSVPLLKEHVGFKRWAAVIVGFVGVILMTKPGGGFEWPMLLMLAAAFGWSLVALATRKLGEEQSAQSILFYTLMGFASTMWIVQFWVWQPLDGSALLLIAFVALFGVAAQFLITKAYTLANPAITSPFEYTGLVWAAIFGYLIWGDFPDWISVMGGLLIVGSGIFIIYREAKLSKVKCQSVP